MERPPGRAAPRAFKAAAPAPTVAPVPDFAALPLSELSRQLHTADATVAPLASASAAADHHALAPAALSDAERRLYSTFIAEHMLEIMQPGDADALAYPIDALHVRDMLAEPFDSFQSCVSDGCIGRALRGGFALRQFLTPAQNAHYHATGQMPPPADQATMCYLCLLLTMTVAAELAAADAGGEQKRRRKTFRQAFFHIVDAPGGYVPAAMRAATGVDGLLLPLRAINLLDYVPDERTVHLVGSFDATGVVTDWDEKIVRGYSEVATLLYGSGHQSVASVLSPPIVPVAFSALPSCEDVLCRRLLDKAQMTRAVSFVAMHDLATKVLAIAAPPLGMTLGGIVAPDEIVLPAPTATLQQRVWALTFRPLPVARAIFMHMVTENLNDWQRVARDMRLLPSQWAASPAEHERAESLEQRPLSTHLIMYLVEARVRELRRLLDERVVPRELDGAIGRPDAVTAALALPGMRDQLRAYLAALAPFAAEIETRRVRLRALGDTVWWAVGEPLLLYLRLRPQPQPTYFAAEDLTDFTFATSVATRPSAGAAIAHAVNGLPVAAGMAIDAWTWGDFDAAVAHVPDAPLLTYWRPGVDWFAVHLTADTAATLDTLLDAAALDQAAVAQLNEQLKTAPSARWRTIAWRVNAAYAVLLDVLSRLAAADAELDAMAADPSVWLPDDWAAELAQRIAAAVAGPAPIVDVLRDLMPLASGMEPIAPGVRRLLAGIDTLTGLAQALKHFLAEEVVRVVAELGGAPMFPLHDGAMRDTTAGLGALDFVTTRVETSVYSWVLSAAAPTNAHINDFTARHTAGVQRSEDYAEWAATALYATLVGAYPHARNVAPFHAWISYALLLSVAPAPTRTEMLAAYAEAQVGGERVMQLALREHLVRALPLVAATALHVRAVYDDWGAFERATRGQCELLRANVAECSLPVANDAVVRASAKAGQAWLPYKRPGAPFVTLVAECFRAVDIELYIDFCMAERRIATVDELALPDEMLRGIGAFVEREQRTRSGFDEAWLREIGTSEQTASFFGAIRRELARGQLSAAAVQVRLRQLADGAPRDYARASIFFWTLHLHAGRALYTLDPATTAAQEAAIADVSSFDRHASRCVVSSVSCCNIQRTFVVQSGGMLSGTMPIRLNLDTMRLSCVTKRGHAYAASRSSERQTNSAALRTHLAAWIAVATAPDPSLVAGDLDAHTETLRDKLRAHAQTLVRARYVLPCNASPVITYQVAGAVFEQTDDHGVGVSCTVCPRCGRKTAFSVAMFSSNMFSCGACETVRAPPPSAACVLCSHTPEAINRSVRTAGSGAAHMLGLHHATYTILDDVAARGMIVVRDVWMCMVCNTRWMPGAVGRFTLSEIRWLRANQDYFRGRIDDLTDNEQLEALLRDLRDYLSGRAHAVPVPGRTHLTQYARSTKRRCGPVKSG